MSTPLCTGGRGGGDLEDKPGEGDEQLSRPPVREARDGGRRRLLRWVSAQEVRLLAEHDGRYVLRGEGRGVSD